MTGSDFAVVSLRGDVPQLDDASDDAVGPFRQLVLDPARGSEALIEAVADAEIATPWILVGGFDHHEVAAHLVARVLEGAIGVFGLAGVVLEGTQIPDGIREHEVPAAVTTDDVAASVRSLAADIAAWGPRVPEPWARVIASSRTDVAVRATLARRALADDPAYRPRALTPEQLALLRDVARRIVPQGEGATIDLAARLDRMIEAGESDGWRPTGMSTDVEAYRAGLDALAAIWMRGAAAQDAVIRRVIDGDAPSGAVLTADQLSLWFEDARNDLARLWLSHPASLARVGYSGFATGGTGPEPAGYLVLAAGEREEWEPGELGRLGAAKGSTA
ncbi:hypothetical protein [Microbacterium sp. AG238]|uniref:hypothetical protein n=1 Tax=Microbacterium sp. AG238 TaxID=2183994 RepID=UPI000E74F8CD|nr:hypothetical protein [Microbacterium sp. AG238]RKE60370.1 hypothetical protein DEU36_2805 [Microbacterium sp. AG238]